MMGRYLVELYLARGAAHEVTAATARVRAAAAELDDEVRCLRSIYVPDEETWFLLYDAPTAAAVLSAVDRAGLPKPRAINPALPG
jgi:hypothetical protein